MGLTVGRTKAALRKFDPSQEYWHNAKILIDSAGAATIVTYWRNPELAGIWELRYQVSAECSYQLMLQKLVEQDGSKDQNSYTLSIEGWQRLGKS